MVVTAKKERLESRRKSSLLSLGLWEDHQCDPRARVSNFLSYTTGEPMQFLIGCDFGVPRKAGDQAKKIILIEAVQVGDHHFQINADGRNERLVRHHMPSDAWKKNRRGWTLPDLADSLVTDSAVTVAAFDFPFSIPKSLLDDAAFAGRVNQPAFQTREQWAGFVSSNFRLQFNSDKANAELADLANFDAWRDKSLWRKRATDMATKGSPPLKHNFQNLFAMTIAGAALLNRLETSGYHIVLDTVDGTPDRCVFETYPREVASRAGFTGSYKKCPGDCLAKAEEYLEQSGVTLDCDQRVRRFCQEYRTSGNDPDGADAFLCLVAAIAFNEGLAEMCDGGATADILKEEAAMVVPKRLDATVEPP